MDQFSEILRNKKRRSKIMNQASIQSSCEALNVDIGYLSGKKSIFVTEENIALYVYNNHYCVIWKSSDVSFDRAIKELKSNFKRVDS